MGNKILTVFVSLLTFCSVISPISAMDKNQSVDNNQPNDSQSINSNTNAEVPSDPIVENNGDVVKNGENTKSITTESKNEEVSTIDDTSDMQGLLNFKYQSLSNGVWQSEKANNEISGFEENSKPITGLKFILDDKIKQYGDINVALKVNNVYSDYKNTNDIISVDNKNISGIKIILTDKLAENYDIYYRAFIDNKGWQAWNKNGTTYGFDDNEASINALQVVIYNKNDNCPIQVGNQNDEKLQEMNGIFNSTYEAHSQNKGWLSPVKLNQTAGITGQSLAVEAIKFNLPDEVKKYGDISIEAYSQDLGWQSPVNSGMVAGSVGQSKRMEAIKINLTEELAQNYDIYYRAHVEDQGWLGWAKNGELAGSEGYGKRIEALVINIVKKGEVFDTEHASPTVDPIKIKENEMNEIVNTTYEAHSQMKGWQSPVKLNQIAGTTGQGLAMEALRINLPSDAKKYGDVSVDVHSSDLGWLNSANSGAIAGSVGKSKSIEGFKIKLTGELADKYDIYYKAHVEGKGWLGWAKNGELSGSTGCQRRVEAIAICIVKKGTAFNVGSAASCSEKYYPNKAKFYYRAHCQDYGWMNSVLSDAVAGTTGKSKRMEAFLIAKNDPTMVTKGTINAKAYCQDYGWLSTVSAGHTVGVTGKGKRLEAISLTLSSTALKNDYDIYYRTHVEGIGWLGWAKNGTVAGSTGCSRSIEAIQIAIYPKRAKCPIKTSTSTTSKKKTRAYKPVYYSQHDSRWGSNQYGRYNLSSTGCVPTCVAMAVAGIKSPWVTPKHVADFLWSKTNQFNKLFVGSSGLAIKQAADYYGVNYHPISSLSDLNSQLSQGRIVIGLQSANSSFVDYAPGPEWTHAIVLYGYKSGGYCNVYDPNTSSRNKVYATGTLWSQRSTYQVDSNYKGVVFHALY